MRVLRVKVFTTNITDANPCAAGQELTEECDKFLETGRNRHLVSVHTSANQHGWMLTIVYEVDK